jgi:16S rRNA processing protein RimM
VAIARILGAHGLRGDVKIELLAPDGCFRPGERVLVAGAEHRIQRFAGPGSALLKLDGIDSREQAAALRDEYLQAPEDSLEPLPEGEYYRFQLIGLAVRTTDGRDLGAITDVITTGGTDVYVASGPLGEVLIPATEQVIMGMDLTAKTMTIEPIPGLLPD